MQQSIQNRIISQSEIETYKMLFPHYKSQKKGKIACSWLVFNNPDQRSALLAHINVQLLSCSLGMWISFPGTDSLHVKMQTNLPKTGLKQQGLINCHCTNSTRNYLAWMKMGLTTSPPQSTSNSPSSLMHITEINPQIYMCNQQLRRKIIDTWSATENQLFPEPFHIGHCQFKIQYKKISIREACV